MSDNQLLCVLEWNKVKYKKKFGCIYRVCQKHIYFEIHAIFYVKTKVFKKEQKKIKTDIRKTFILLSSRDMKCVKHTKKSKEKTICCL